MLRRTLLLTPLLIPATANAAAKPKRPSAKVAAEAAIAAANPAQTPIGPFDTAAKYAIVLDYNTNTTLLDKDADVSMVPSSLTKLMTAYIVYGFIKAGKIALSSELPVSQKAWAMGGSKMYVALNSMVHVEDLIRGMIVQSGNDACIVLAEGLAGSEEQFVALMNAKAKEFGLTKSVFRNCTGWPDPEHRMSARDISTVARRLIQDFPEFYRYDSEREFEYNHIKQQNRNPLVQRGTADGLKTGHTKDGGFGLAVSAERDGRRVIIVVNGLDEKSERGEEGERLLDWAFREWVDVRLFTAGDTVEDAPVWMGSAATVPLVGGRELIATLPRDWKQRTKIAIEYTSPLPAPVVRGTQVGRLVVSGQGVPDMSVPLLVGADVPRLGVPGRAMAVLSHWISG